MNSSMHWLDKFQGDILRDELIAPHTSLKVGGPSDLFLVPKSIDDVCLVMNHLENQSLFVLGEGSNLIAGDKGFRGIVLSLGKAFKDVSVPEFSTNEQGEEVARVTVGASAKMSYLVKYLAKYSLTGMEDLVGIPGSMGGALVMNAGADGQETCQVVRKVTVVTHKGKIKTWTRDQLKFQYRKTTFPEKGCILVEAELELKKGDLVSIQSAIDCHLKRRSQKQPLSMPNSGSVFKNPEGDTAGRLIEAAGLKGHAIGDASVSIKHANFIVNKGDAKAEDIISLIEHIKEVVREHSGVQLETEVVIAGEF